MARVPRIDWLVHEVSTKFPKAELFVLTSQIKRAADSVNLNIAEGVTGQYNPEFKKFLGYAIRSGVEVVACIYVAKRRKIISEEDFRSIYNFVDSLLKRIQALKKSYKVKHSEPSPWTVDHGSWTLLTCYQPNPLK